MPAVGRTAVITVATPAIGRARVVSKFGAYLDEAMREAELNDVALARRARIDKSNISHWRSGRAQPQLKHLRLIAPHIKRRLGDLLIVAHDVTPEELGMVARPLPTEVHEFVENLEGAPEPDRQAALTFLRELTKFYRTIKPTPKKRSRSGQRQ